jgi:glutathione reductase (NADPH)
MPRFDFDLFTLGAGSAGVRASRLAARLGVRVGLAEEGRVGGTCVLRGCVPKKLLVIGSHFAHDMIDARGYGWTIGSADFSWPALIAAKNAEIARLNGVYLDLLAQAGVTLIQGRAGLLDAHTVEVAGRRHTAERILIATGSWPSLPAIPGIELAITSNEALDLPALPGRLAVVGGGYIAAEFAGLFNALGAKIDLVYRGEALLRGFDRDIRLALSEEMVKQGIRVLTRTRVQAIRRDQDGRLRLAVESDGPDGAYEIAADAALYATGRKPNTRGLGLAEIGVRLDDDGAVVVDRWSQSSVPGIYAIGDVTDRMNLTPVALAEANCLIETLFNGNPTAMDYAGVPSAVFSQPPVATVGLSEEEARQRNGALDIYVSRFRPLRHTLSGRDERTMMKLVVRRADQRVVGCHMVGADAPEIIQGLAVALKCGATKAQFDSTVGIHPTAAEEFVTMRDRVPDH